MKIVVANLASPANPGDQAIFRGTLKLLRSVYGNPEVTVVTRAYSERYVYEALGCRVTASYPNVEFMSSDFTFQKILGIPKALLKPLPLASVIKESDAVFLVGGAYFYSYRPGLPGFTFLSHLSAIAWAKRYKKPLIFLPQSYGPFRSKVAREMFDWGVGLSDLVFYRESISGNWLKQRYPGLKDKLVFMPDLALNLEKDDLFKASLPHHLTGMIGVTVRAWKSGHKDQEVYLKALREALIWFQREYDLTVRVIAQVQDSKRGEGDGWLSRMLVHQLTQKIGATRVQLFTTQPYFELSEICKLHQQCDFLIGMRLHSCLLSYLMGRPALAVGYQHKTEGVLKTLGLEGLYLGTFEALSKESMIEGCRELWREKTMWATKIKASLSQAREQIQETFRDRIRQVIG